ncbi:MAG: acyloxyacyl hydrolase [Pseudomonadota bacterium]|nr:acyloxyacyl hydrolase [Pseudomonadota bacterium]
MALIALLVVASGQGPTLADELDKFQPKKSRSFVSFGAAYYDFIKENGSGEIHLEYRDGNRLWLFKPFAGALATTDGSVYPYAGLLTDFYFGERLVVSPSVAAGPYFRGGGKNLGSVFEIRSGLEIAYRFENRVRLGLTFYHISNAGVGNNLNPGVEALGLTYSIPLN